MWSEVYRPKTLEDMVGNYEVREKLVALVGKWKKGSKAALLVGSPGTGKTTTVQLVAKKLGLNLVQLNASDRRTKEMLTEKIGEALLSTNLFGEKTLIFLDEVDGLAGRADYGALDFIKEAVRRSLNPVVMAANNPESEQVRKLSSVTTNLLFVRPSGAEIKGFLKGITKKEKLSVTDQELEEIVLSANGDVRAAINALQGGILVSKDEEMTVSQSINAFFDAYDGEGALRALRGYPGQPREKVRDLFTSVTSAKIHQERKASALEVISRADVLVGKMVRGQDWRLLRYLDPLLASDLRDALRDGGAHYASEGIPWPLQLRIWNDSRKLKDIAALAGRRLRVSRKGCLVEDMPYFMLLCKAKAFREEFIRSLGLEENYAEFVTKEAARSASS